MRSESGMRGFVRMGHVPVPGSRIATSPNDVIPIARMSDDLVLHTLYR